MAQPGAVSPRWLHRARSWCWILLALSVWPSGVGPTAATAQPAAVDPIGASPKTHSATPLQGTFPRIDGRLDESAWDNAVWMDDFRQLEPVEGARPSQRTEVAFLYDDNALYIGARLYAEGPDDILAPLTRRDNETNAEQLAISLDTYLNRRTAYTFAVTASGVRLDYYHSRDDEDEPDYTFDPVWIADAHIGAEGWTAEMRIPFSQLRFNESDRAIWGLNISRKIPARNEEIYWVVIPRTANGWASRFGTLEGLNLGDGGRRLELQPYVASSALAPESRDPADPFAEPLDATLRVGGDLKLGLGPNLTLDATINPDFGQVEADPAEVNLTVFETFFEERRPFFTEGSDLLNDGLFYSRRIGTSPRGRAQGDYVDRPDNTTILGATKLSGRFASGFSLAALGALTDHEHARTFDVQADAFGRVRVEPRAGYLAVAAQQEFGRDQSTVSFIGTTVLRDQASDAPTASVLNNEALAGRVAWNLRRQGGAYEFRGEVGTTHVQGTPERIANLQRNSAHFFQRPDAEHVRFDPTRTQLTGYAGFVALLKNSGSWVGNSFLVYETPEYEPNDLGQLGRADQIDWITEINYRETEPGPVFHRYSVELDLYSGWNTAGEPMTSAIDTWVVGVWKNFWATGIGYGINPRDFSDTVTRGGPRMEIAPEQNVVAAFESNPAHRLQGNGTLFYEWDALDRRQFEVSGAIAWQPTPQLDLSLAPRYSSTVGRLQYVTTRTEGGPDATFGGRYIFSDLDRSEVATQLRVNYTFTPDLTLEVYAEPFASSGRFYNFGELAEAGGRDLRRYGMDGSLIEPTENGVLVVDGDDQFVIRTQDFNVRSFRSNVVLRWEWVPGSVAYLVWQQDRSDFDTTGRFVRPGSVFNAIGAPGDHFFSLKVSYWIPVR
ncbi:MAG: DUF5916 domain-containing protein [Bacteroidota bacterium]